MIYYTAELTGGRVEGEGGEELHPWDLITACRKELTVIYYTPLGTNHGM